MLACIAVFIFCVLNIEKLIKFRGAVAGLFTAVSSKARKTKISSSIRASIMKTAKAFQSNGLNILPNDVKIDWVEVEDKDTFFKDNRLIIRMSRKNNPHENFVNAVLEFVSVGLLHKERRYINSEIMKAADISVIQKLLLGASEKSLIYFNEKILTQMLNEDDELKDTIKEIATIDGNGMFTNILLNEYAKAGNKIFPQLPDPLLLAESREFLHYLYRIAMRVCTTYDDFVFNREYFRTFVFLAYRTKTYEEKGLKPYLNTITKYINRGIETIYVFGLVLCKV